MRWERRYIEDWLPSSIVVGVLCGIAGVVMYALLQLGFTLILSSIGEPLVGLRWACSP